jgi:hypothetical protein
MPKIKGECVRAIVTLLLLVAAAYDTGKAVFAMPMFARKLGVPCSTCHTSPPRLNETGYQFRAAGYRMPSEIGKSDEKEPFNFFDYNGVRLQARYDAANTRIGPDATQKNKFSLYAMELYAFTGPWGKYLSSNLKTTIFPEKPSDTEDHLRVEGNIKLTVGGEKRFFGSAQAPLIPLRVSARRTLRSPTHAHICRIMRLISTRRRSSRRGKSIRPERHSAIIKGGPQSKRSCAAERISSQPPHPPSNIGG